MRSRSTLSLLAGLVVLAAGSAAKADPNECRAAMDKFNTQRADVLNAMQGFGHCVTVNDGRDQCSSQFSELESAHYRFDEAVSDYKYDCGSH